MNFKLFFSHPTKILVVLIIIGFGCIDIVYAQTSVEGGFSVGFNRHTFSVDDQSVMLQPGIALAGTYGFPIVIKKDKWELHTGLYGNELSQSFYFATPNGAYGLRSFSNGLSSFKIPLHIGRALKWTEVTNLSPQIGIAWLTSQRTGALGYGSGIYGGYVEYETVSHAVSKHKFMAEAGLDANIALFRGLTLVIGAHYSLGLQTMEEVEVSYRVNNSQTYEGTMISKGTGWKFNIGLMLPLYSW